MATVKMMPFVVQPFIPFLLALPLLRKKGFSYFKDSHMCAVTPSTRIPHFFPSTPPQLENPTPQPISLPSL